MPLHSRVIDRLFEALHVRYGGAFLAQWPDTDTDAIKADWANVLQAYAHKLPALKFALDHLPPKPVNAIAFRDLARCMPDDPVKFLPPVKADEQKVQAAMSEARVAAQIDKRSPAERLVDDVFRRSETGRLSSAQLHVMRHSLSVLRHGDERLERARRMGIEPIRSSVAEDAP